MEDVPPDLQARVARFGETVDLAIELVLAVRPERLPGEQLRIAQQQPPEAGERPVTRRPAGGEAGIPFHRLAVAFDSAPHVDAPLARQRLAVAAKTRDVRAGLFSHDRSLNQQVEWPRSLGTPRQAVKIVALRIVLNDGQVPRPIVGVVEAKEWRRPAPRIYLEAGWKVRIAAQLAGVAAFFDPGETLHAASFGGRQDCFEHVPIRMLWRAA